MDSTLYLHSEPCSIISFSVMIYSVFLFATLDAWLEFFTSIFIFYCSIYIFHLTCTQPTTSDHINMKYIWGPRGKPYGDHTLITHRDLQKVYTLNKYNFFIFIYYKKTTKILNTHINLTLCEYLFLQYITI